MNFCSNCGKELKGDSNFCPSCGCPIKSSDNLSSPNDVVEKVITHITDYKLNNYLPLAFILYFISIITMNIYIVFIFLFISWYVLYADSKKIGAGKCASKEKISPMTWKPFSWLLFTIFFWIISYPYYMYKRREIWEINLDC